MGNNVWELLYNENTRHLIEVIVIAMLYPGALGIQYKLKIINFFLKQSNV